MSPKKISSVEKQQKGAKGPSSVSSRLMESFKSWGGNENKSKFDIPTYNMISYRVDNSSLNMSLSHQKLSLKPL